MCDSCGCSCKSGKPEKGCDCKCAQCRAARESVAKSLVEIGRVAKGISQGVFGTAAARNPAVRSRILAHVEGRQAAKRFAIAERTGDARLGEKAERGVRSGQTERFYSMRAFPRGGN